jgi:hypothetical protein
MVPFNPLPVTARRNSCMSFDANLPVITLNAIQGKNTKGAPIFSLAFGENADYNFLRKMSAQNNAFSRKIYEASEL